MLSSSHYLKTSSYRSPAPQYYQPSLSIWLSVDPMADKYPGVSPYVYCGNNPVRLVDVDGKTFYEVDGERKKIDDGHNNITIYDVSLRKFNRLEKLYNHQNYSKYNRVKTRLANRNGYSEGFSNEKGVSITYHQGKSIRENAATLLNTADIAIRGSSRDNMWEGHGDGFDRRFSEEAEPYAMGAMLMHPIIGTFNAIKTITTRSDIYGVPSTQTDIGMSWISLGLTASALPELELFNQLYNVSIGIWSSVQYKKRGNEKK